MTAESLVAFNLILLAAIASPGPSLLFLIRTTLTNGRRAGMITGAGLATMAAAWTLMALLGLNGVFALFPWAYLTLKTAGALYLIWIAVQIWRHARAGIGAAPPPSDRGAFVSGLLVNLGNPKSVLFAGAVLLVVFPATLTPGDKALIFINHLAVELTVLPVLALLLSTAPIRSRYLRAKPVLDRMAAAVLGALGLRLILEK